jgi:hypothetical protein
MATFRIPLPKELPEDVCGEIAKRTCYCDHAIEGARYVKDGGDLEVVVSPNCDVTAVEVKVRKLVAKMKTERLAVQPRTLRSRSGSNAAYASDVFERLCNDEDIRTEGTGIVARGGQFLNFLSELDRFLERLAWAHFRAPVRSYPVLIPSEWLRRAGYFASFPHSLTFAMHLGEDYDRLEEFARRHKKGEPVHFNAIEELTQPEYCLSPAVCYHAYGGLMDRTLAASEGGLRTFTAVGRCFRYESKNITDLDRLWEFSMREIVFVGEGPRVLEARERSIELTWRLVELLDLHAEIATAADPFFATDFNALRYFQLSNELKFELQLPVNPERTIACASFNYHEQFFGSRFNVKTAAGEDVHTGCAAFGLERFVYACLSQLGMSESRCRLREAEAELLKDAPGR